MGVKVKTTKDDFPEMKKVIKSLDGTIVQCGVFGEQAWLAGIHEYGCRIEVTPKMRAYLHRQGLHLKDSTTHIVIPERSFLRTGFDENEEEILKKVDDLLPYVLNGEISHHKFFKFIGLLMKSAIQDYARDLDNPPNHPYTIAHKKGSENPLVDTGDMIGAIDYKVVKNE